MIEVALETSCRKSSVALRAGESALEQGPIEATGALGALEELMRAARVQPAEIDAVYVGTGPGSYTGLRIGIATALGLARGAGAVLRGEPSGETIAWRELAPGEECVHVLDARRSELYFARYRRVEEGVEVLEPPVVIAPDQLAARLPREAAIFGDLEALRVAGLGAREARRLRPAVIPRAGALLELASLRRQRLGTHALDEVEPLYLRPFEARIRRR